MLAPHLCPSCSHRLLRHVNPRGVYWRCSHCREDFVSTHPALGVALRHNNVVCLSSHLPLNMALVSVS